MKWWEAAVSLQEVPESPLSASCLFCHTRIPSFNHLSLLPVLSTLFIFFFCKKKKKILPIFCSYHCLLPQLVELGFSPRFGSSGVEDSGPLIRVCVYACTCA